MVYQPKFSNLRHDTPSDGCRQVGQIKHSQRSNDQHTQASHAGKHTQASHSCKAHARLTHEGQTG